jgi:hypothetical protein
VKASAYIVGPSDGSGAALINLARCLDFASVTPYGGIAEAEAQSAITPVCFFLFAAVEDVGRLQPIADAIRFCPNRRVRFSPLVYFADNPSIETITRCIAMGFDDVITMPFTTARITGRINRQIGQSLIYYETAGYFGPDRRDRVTAPSRAAESRLGGQFRRLEIVRSLSTGINVLRDDLHMLPG